MLASVSIVVDTYAMTALKQPDSFEFWAQYHTVGPYGYACSDGDVIDRPTPAAAEALLNHHDVLQDICWVNFSLYIDGDEDHPLRVGESIIAIRQQRIHSVRFKPISEVIASRQIPRHTAKWMSYLIAGERESKRGYDEPDRFEDLLLLAHRNGALTFS